MELINRIFTLLKYETPKGMNITENHPGTEINIRQTKGYHVALVLKNSLLYDATQQKTQSANSITMRSQTPIAGPQFIS